MALMRIQARLPRDGGAPEDDSVNVWHFDGSQSFGEDADDTVGRLKTFYTAIGGYLSPILAGTVHFKVYDMENTPPRVPVYVDTSGTFTPGGTAYPAEVAICLSFYAQPTSGLDQARRRGRVYLGPLAGNVGEYTGGQPDIRVEQAKVDAICAAAAELAVGPDPGDARLAVYSPTTDQTASTADAFNDVVGGWVDNAFDIQRRRGAKPTVRTAWVPA